jgi:hypothetical protein
MFDQHSYAAVNVFSATIIFDVGGVVRGVAAPTRGSKPCAVKLTVAGDTVSAAKAIRFSQEAATSQTRFGWCGFELGGLQAASALGSPIQIRCIATDSVLGSWEATEIHGMSFSNTKRSSTVLEYISLVKMTYGCSDLVQVLPFMARYAIGTGHRALCETILEYTFQRAPSAAEVDQEIDHMRQSTHLKDYLTDVERKVRSQHGSRTPTWAGPFEAKFPFGLEVFE